MQSFFQYFLFCQHSIIHMMNEILRRFDAIKRGADNASRISRTFTAGVKPLNAATLSVSVAADANRR